jgi:hypothetical protein
VTDALNVLLFDVAEAYKHVAACKECFKRLISETVSPARTLLHSQDLHLSKLNEAPTRHNGGSCSKDTIPYSCCPWN